MAFELHPRLREDTVPLGHLPLCAVRLSRDAHYPWLVLVPEREGITEAHALAAADHAALWEEVRAIASASQSLLGAHKMNVAALGNQVPQLHVHVVARFRDDPAWPGPIWGARAPRAYTDTELAARLTAFHTAFSGLVGYRDA